MLLRQLYRYVFGEWSDLTEEEINNIPVFFKDFSSNKFLEYTVWSVNAKELYQKLYKREYNPNLRHYGPNDYHWPRESTIKTALIDCNTRHNYFADVNDESIFKAYKRLFFLFELNEIMTRAYPRETKEIAYKVLVLFGGEDNFEEVISVFDTQCEAIKMHYASELLEGPNFELRQSASYQSITLPQWRIITQQAGLETGRRLFYIATEIEELLGRAPENHLEAVAAAELFTFANTAQYPELANFCVTNYLPEELFDQCTSPDPSIRIKAHTTIFHVLPNDKLPEFVAVLPHMKADLAELGNLLQLLLQFFQDQSVLLNKFPQELVNAIHSLDDFEEIQKIITGTKVLEKLITVLTAERVRTFFTSCSHLNTLIGRLSHNTLDNPGYIKIFIRDVIGYEKLNTLINDKSSYYYPFLPFVSSLLRWSNSSKKTTVPYLKETIGVEKIKSFTTSVADLINHLTVIDSSARVSYIADLVGANHLRTLLKNNWRLLSQVLCTLQPNERFEVLFDVIGVDTLRKIVPHTPDRRPHEGIASLLPAEQQPLFLNGLFTKEELKARKSIKETKTTITTMPWNTGWGGVELTLDNGEKRLVPGTVKLQWDVIKDAEAARIPYDHAWDKIVTFAEEAKTSSRTLTHFSRDKMTSNYYKSFHRQSPDTEDLTNNLFIAL